MNKLITLIPIIALVGCEQTFNLGTPSPTGPTNITNTNTNTNNNNNTTDRSDTGNDDNDNDDNDTPSTGVIPLPAYGEAVTRLVAQNNTTLLANSCQDKFGETAWQFLDKLVKELRFHAGDQRWGYLCKDSSCTRTARDVVAYRAGSSNTGIWIVDVIGNHCPGPNDPAPAFRWGVLPFETIRPWSEVHH